MDLLQRGLTRVLFCTHILILFHVVVSGQDLSVINIEGSKVYQPKVSFDGTKLVFMADYDGRAKPYISNFVEGSWSNPELIFPEETNGRYRVQYPQLNYDNTKLYFSASSLGVSAIGAFTQSSLGGVGAFRDLDCPAQTPCQVFPNNWSGLIHQDSLMISQALWEVRQSLVANPPAPGPTLDCADGLVYQALFFFPDSFEEFLDAMVAVSADSSNLVPACGADNSQNGLIIARRSQQRPTRTQTTHPRTVAACRQETFCGTP